VAFVGVVSGLIIIPDFAARSCIEHGHVSSSGPRRIARQEGGTDAFPDRVRRR